MNELESALDDEIHETILDLGQISKCLREVGGRENTRVVSTARVGQKRIR